MLFAFAEEHQPLSIQRLTREAELIVRATVHSITVSRDSRERIFSTVNLELTETWKGHPGGKKIQLVHGGGILGEIGRKVIGQAGYQLEEDLVLFLVSNGEGKFVTVGMADGKFSVEKNAGNPEMVRQASATRDGALTLIELKQTVQKSIHD